MVSCFVSVSNRTTAPAVCVRLDRQLSLNLTDVLTGIVIAEGLTSETVSGAELDNGRSTDVGDAMDRKRQAAISRPAVSGRMFGFGVDIHNEG